MTAVNNVGSLIKQPSTDTNNAYNETPINRLSLV